MHAENKSCQRPHSPPLGVCERSILSLREKTMYVRLVDRRKTAAQCLVAGTRTVRRIVCLLVIALPSIVLPRSKNHPPLGLFRGQDREPRLYLMLRTRQNAMSDNRVAFFVGIWFWTTQLYGTCMYSVGVCTCSNFWGFWKGKKASILLPLATVCILYVLCCLLQPLCPGLPS